MRTPSFIQYCNHCGGKTVNEIPEDDNRCRHVCHACGVIQYQNPKIVTGCIPVWKEKILLCRRAIEPRYGYWTVPAGFMENDETIEQGAARETLEEACAEVRDLQLYQITSVLRANQVYILFRAGLTAADAFAPGRESLEAKLVSPARIPWQEMAFKVVTNTLKRYLREAQSGGFSIETDTL